MNLGQWLGSRGKQARNEKGCFKNLHVSGGRPREWGAAVPSVIPLASPIINHASIILLELIINVVMVNSSVVEIIF